MGNTKTKNTAFIFAIFSAVTYGISFPLSKVLLTNIPPFFMAGLLYAGSGIGMFIMSQFIKKEDEEKIGRKELPTVMWMVILNVIASFFLMLGIHTASAGTVSLLSNFEIVATTVIARLIFKERLGRRMFTAVLLIFISSMLLTVGDFSKLNISMGAVYTIIACICWGAENNTTNALSHKDPLQVVIIKSLSTAVFSILIAVLTEHVGINFIHVLEAMLLGFISYGLSLYFYVYAQRFIGAIRTGAYFSAAPFIGLLLSFIIFKENLVLSFWIASLLMIVGTFLVITEKE